MHKGALFWHGVLGSAVCPQVGSQAAPSPWCLFLKPVFRQQLLRAPVRGSDWTRQPVKGAVGSPSPSPPLWPTRPPSHHSEAWCPPCPPSQLTPRPVIADAAKNQSLLQLNAKLGAHVVGDGLCHCCVCTHWQLRGNQVENMMTEWMDGSIDSWGVCKPSVYKVCSRYESLARSSMESE